MTYAGFVESTDAQLVPIRQTKLFRGQDADPERRQAVGEEKKTQIEPIDQQLAALAKQGS